MKKKSGDEQGSLPGKTSFWTDEIDRKHESLINPPDKLPVFSRFMLSIAEKEFGREMRPGRLFAWSNLLGFASGILELFIEKGSAKILDPRMVYLIRLQVSYTVSSAYVIDVNAWKYKDYQISEEEIRAMRKQRSREEVESFSDHERCALAYAEALSLTPPRFSEPLLTRVRKLFSQKEIVAIAALSAKVNYWGRFIEALRINPAGYTDDPVLGLDQYGTFSKPDQ